MSGLVSVSMVDANVAHIRMDDGRGNALGKSMLAAVREGFGKAREADAVLLSGRPRVFCGGLDLVEVGPMTRDELLDFLELFHACAREVFSFPRPLIIAAAGGAIAGGAILVACGDERLGARDEGLIGVNEVRLGVPFPVSALEIVLAGLPVAEGRRAALLGQVVGKEEALRRGWFHSLVDASSLESEAIARAKDAAAISSRAFAITRLDVRGEALRRMEERKTQSHAAFAEAWTGEEAQGRIRRIVEQLTRPKPPQARPGSARG